MSKAFMDDFAEKIFGHKRDGNQCVICGSTKVDDSDFSSDLERREFRISFMCKPCQDKAFAPDEE